ncbi:MAG: HDOD domain-containing protein [Polyangiaceae bacterium]|nr:HDOD domain-containing protein [Polyangiaceae bacterium]
MSELKHILFVDDEEQILGGLRDLLRRQRKRWKMTFALGGAEGIRSLDAGDVDVVVSDMRMPGIDGAAVLRHAHDHHPGTVRIVLSGYSEAEATMRAVPVAHQFLTKPCDAAQLEAVIERACALQALLAERDLRAELGRLDKLPSQPRVYHRILEVLANPESSIGDVARLVERDAAMTLKLLQLVNSGFFGVPRQISDVRHAASLLGLKNLQNLVLSLEIFDPGRHGERTEALQRHALLTGRAASRLVTDRELASDAFLAGVLHDVGFLALFHTQPQRMDEILALAAAGEPVLASERAT